MFLHEIVLSVIDRVEFILGLFFTDDFHQEKLEQDEILLGNKFSFGQQANLYGIKFIVNSSRFQVMVEVNMPFIFEKEQYSEKLTEINKLNNHFNSYSTSLDFDQKFIRVKSFITFAGYFDEDIFDNMNYSGVQSEALMNILCNVLQGVQELELKFNKK